MKHLLTSLLILCAGSVWAADRLVLGLTVNGAVKAVAAPGWPWMVSAAAFDAATGEERPLPPGAVLEVSGAAVKLVRHETLPLWTLPPDAGVAEGNYTLELRTSGGQASAWIVVTPDPPPAAGARELVFSWWLAAQGDSEKALREVETWVANDPSNIAARVRQAELLDALDRSAEAIAALEEAAKLHRQSPQGKIRPVGIRRFQERLLNAETK